MDVEPGKVEVEAVMNQEVFATGTPGAVETIVEDVSEALLNKEVVEVIPVGELQPSAVVDNN